MEYVVKESFISEREIVVVADSLEEAREKYSSGDWSSEVEFDFYSNEVLDDPHGIT